MKKLTGTILILFCIFSCTKNSTNCDSSISCDPVPYDSGWVDVKLNYKGIGIPLILYKGYVEDNEIISMDTAYSDIYYYYLPLGNRYAVQAYYYEANQTIIALDGDKLKQDSYYNCGDQCYNEAEITLDVKKI